MANTSNAKSLLKDAILGITLPLFACSFLGERKLRVRPSSLHWLKKPIFLSFMFPDVSISVPEEPKTRFLLF